MSSSKNKNKNICIKCHHVFIFPVDVPHKEIAIDVCDKCIVDLNLITDGNVEL